MEAVWVLRMDSDLCLRLPDFLFPFLHSLPLPLVVDTRSCLLYTTNFSVMYIDLQKNKEKYHIHRVSLTSPHQQPCLHEPQRAQANGHLH